MGEQDVLGAPPIILLGGSLAYELHSDAKIK